MTPRSPGSKPPGPPGRSSSRPPSPRPPSPRPPGVRPARADARAGQPRPSPRPERVPDRYLYGLHAAAAAIANPERTVTRIQVTEAGLEALRPALAAAAAAGLTRPAPETVERALMDKFLRGAVHQGIAIEVKPLEPPSLDDIGRAASLESRAVLVLLDQVTDPQNVGAVLRSAAAFGALAVVVTDRHAPEVTGVLAKAASGAVEHVPLVRVKNLAQALATVGDWGFRRVGLAEEADGTLSEGAGGADKLALVLGAEGAGLRQLTRGRCDALGRLPTQGAIGSLNVSNAAAIALYEFARGA
jgi:23S rRNA (guanosine2251-2'-O)-methyltransferase